MLNVKDVAARLAVRPSWVYAQAAAGTLPHIRVGKYVRVTEAQLADYLRRQTVSEAGRG